MRLPIYNRGIAVGRSAYSVKRITTHYILRPTVGVVLIALLFLMVAQPLLASGPGTGGSKIQVDNEAAGPYMLLVATSPLPVTVGQMSVWVRVMDTKGETALRDAVVQIEATPSGGGEPIVGQATHQNAGNAIDYVAHLDVQQTGNWDVKVTIEDDLGEAEVAFTETVAGGVSTGLIIGLGLPFIFLLIVVGVYMWRRSASAGEG
ncbi:MAG: hypothetical protein KDJ52_01835 [Anaerolineae bacterium]|nr:hypothetical protein [Anaerolineae bacterium]